MAGLAPDLSRRGIPELDFFFWVSSFVPREALMMGLLVVFVVGAGIGNSGGSSGGIGSSFFGLRSRRNSSLV